MPPANSRSLGLPDQHLLLAEALGLHRDGSLGELVSRALDDIRMDSTERL